MITIKLSEEDARFLLSTLWETQDDGPSGEGWKSDELRQLIENLEQQIN